MNSTKRLACEQKLRLLRGKRVPHPYREGYFRVFPGDRVYLLVDPRFGVYGEAYLSRRDAVSAAKALADRDGLEGYLVQGPFIRREP